MHTLIGFLVISSSICRHLPWAWLKTLSLLSQVQAQVAQKNVQRVEGRLARHPPLAVAQFPPPQQSPQLRRESVYNHCNHQRIRRVAARTIGSISSHRGIREGNFSVILWPKTNLVWLSHFKVCTKQCID